LLLVHLALRQLMYEASCRAGCDPDRLSESAASRPFFRAACDGCCDARLRVEGIGLSVWLT
jgi:hypothetical protein